jgi:CAAX protease family protein
MEHRAIVAVVLLHLIASFILLVSPWLARWRYRRLQEQIAAGQLGARVRRYRLVLLNQVAMVVLFSALCLLGRIPFRALGLCAPGSWVWSIGAALVFAALFGLSAVLLRPKAAALRAKMQNRMGALLPESPEDMKWFAAISFGSGIAEELVYRGFWFYYLGRFLPHLGNIEKVLITALIFGVVHLYQGFWGMAGTGAAGVILGYLYVLTGSLLLPGFVHAIGNVRAVVIFWPKADVAISSE